jgi:branched-subunit amino acid aminotransferase/4-amino-4-deoxychorismate lyase
VLKGISRKQILNFAPKYYKVEERVLKVEELKNAKEAFITSSTKGAHPIVQIDDIVIGDGKVGPVSKDILEKFNEWKVSYIKSMVESQVSIAD